MDPTPAERRRLHYKVWSLTVGAYLLAALSVLWLWRRFPFLFYFAVVFAIVSFVTLWKESLAPRYRARETRQLMEPLLHSYGIK